MKKFGSESYSYTHTFKQNTLTSNTKYFNPYAVGDGTYSYDAPAQPEVSSQKPKSKQKAIKVVTPSKAKQTTLITPSTTEYEPNAFQTNMYCKDQKAQGQGKYKLNSVLARHLGNSEFQPTIIPSNHPTSIKKYDPKEYRRPNADRSRPANKNPPPDIATDRGFRGFQQLTGGYSPGPGKAHVGSHVMNNP